MKAAVFLVVSLSVANAAACPPPDDPYVNQGDLYIPDVINVESPTLDEFVWVAVIGAALFVLGMCVRPRVAE